MDRQYKPRQGGFTLLEILAALMILAIALTAIVLSSIESTHNIDYLEDKTVASWIGKDLVTQIRLGLIDARFAPAGSRGTTKALDKDWPWIAYVEPTDDQYTLKISVIVGTTQNPNLIRFTSFMSNPNEED